MDNEILELQTKFEQVKSNENAMNVFEQKKEEIANAPVKVDEKGKLVEDMFKDGIKYQVAHNSELQEQVLETAKTYTNTKMQIIQTDVDTEYKEAVFNNRKDACESYGFNETTTPVWATKIMSIGYSIMLAIWLLVGSFTFMPVIFIAKKMAVGLKKTWIAVIFALLIYLGVTFVPILLALLNK